MRIRNVEKAEYGPRKHKPYFHNLFDQWTVGVARIAPDGRFLVVNPALCHMLGYGKIDLLKKTCQELTHPDDRAGEDALIRKMLAGHTTSYKSEKRYLRRSGVPLWVVETASAVTDYAGSLLYRVCLFQANERKIAEEHFCSAVEAAASGMVMTNQKGKIVLVNSQTEKLFGYSRDELLGRLIDVLLAIPFKETEQCFLAELTSRLKNRSTEARWDIFGRRRNGELFPVKLGSNAIHTLNGTWILSSIVDMSEFRPENNLHKIAAIRFDSIARQLVTT